MHHHTELASITFLPNSPFNQNLNEIVILVSILIFGEYILKVI